MISTSAAFLAKLEAPVNFPKVKLLSFDPALDTWGEIIDGTYSQTPTDLTAYVQKMEWGYNQLSVQLADDSNLSFHPDGGVLRTKIRSGRIIRLYEGFEGLAETDWLVTFSGTVEGTYSWTYTRNSAIQIDFSVYNRGNNQAWKRRPVTSRNFSVGTDYGLMFQNIAKDIMALTTPEVLVPAAWSASFDKNSNQYVAAPPWDGLEGLLFLVMRVPWFNGKGQLTSVQTTQDRVTYSLTDDTQIVKYDAKGGNVEVVNKVVITYLDNQLSEVDGEWQVLGTASVTTGFFTPSVELDVYYSDDRRTRGRNTQFLIKQSVNSGLIPVGSESYQELDVFHGRITIEVSSYVPILATVLLALYLGAAIIPDLVITLGFIVSGGVTVSVGRIIEAIAMVTMLILMMSLGTGQYEVWGIPYEMVYLEKQYIAIVSGLEFWQEREKTITNQFISTETQARPLALNELFKEQMKGHPRTLTLKHDPRYEPGDIIQFSNGTKFYIDDAKKSIQRNNGPTTIELTGYRCLL